MSRAPKTNFIYLWRDQDTSKNIRKYVETSWKILSLEIWHSKISKIFDLCVCVLGTSFSVFFILFFLWFFDYIFLEIILRRWGLENDELSINKIEKSLDMNFISIKKHETKFTLNFLIFKDGTLNFLIFKGIIQH